MFVLGTAAFGFPYGIMNKVGSMSQKQVTNMVNIAYLSGINEFDTAQMYHNSESYLGQAFEDLGIQKRVKVITKLHPETYGTMDSVTKSIEDSTKRLRIPKLHGVLLHRERLLNHPYIMEMLNEIKNRGFMNNVGISVYLPEFALQAIRSNIVDIVQFPSCILDRRFEKAGTFEFAKDRKKEIYLRNIFLQGLLLTTSSSCHISAVKPELKKLDYLCKKFNLSRLEIVINYLKTIAPEAKLIFGAETQDQIKKCLDTTNYFLTKEMIDEIKRTFSNVQDEVLIPKLWRKN